MSVVLPIEHLQLTAPPEIERPSESMVADLERRIGAWLPVDYREFLATYGGCRIEFEVPIKEPSPFGGVLVQTGFLGLGADPDHCEDIRSYLSSTIVPRNMIVIASGDFGRITTLSFAGIDKGSVFFFDEHQMACADETHNYGKLPWVKEFFRLRDCGEIALENKPPGYENCYFCASSFTEFLRACIPITEDEDI